jgi:hypothetical protein
MKVIDSNYIAFLPFRYIWNVNVLLAHETINWAKQTKQEMIFLKLDFAKAYNMVTWDF